MNSNLIQSSSIEKFKVKRHNSIDDVTRKIENKDYVPSGLKRSVSERVRRTLDPKMERGISSHRVGSDQDLCLYGEPITLRKELSRRQRRSFNQVKEKDVVPKDSLINRNSTSTHGTSTTDESDSSSSSDCIFPMPLEVENAHPTVTPSSITNSTKQLSSTVKTPKPRSSSNKFGSSRKKSSMKKSSDKELEELNSSKETEIDKKQSSINRIQRAREQQQEQLLKLDSLIDTLSNPEKFHLSKKSSILESVDHDKQHLVKQDSDKRLVKRQQSQERLLQKQQQQGSFRKEKLVRQDSTRLTRRKNEKKLDTESQNVLLNKTIKSKTSDVATFNSNHEPGNSMKNAQKIKQKSNPNKSMKKKCLWFDSSYDKTYPIKSYKHYKEDLWWAQEECDNNRQREMNLLFTDDPMSNEYAKSPSIYLQAMLRSKEEISTSNSTSIEPDILGKDTYENLKMGIKLGFHGINCDEYLGYIKTYVRKIVLTYQSCQNVLNFERNDLHKLIRSRSESITKCDRSYAAIVGQIIHEDCIEMNNGNENLVFSSDLLNHASFNDRINKNDWKNFSSSNLFATKSKKKSIVSKQA